MQADAIQGTGRDGRPRMIDVGRVAGVSAQTVSRYFTGGYVSPEAKERVEDAIQTLGYRLNSAARRLKANKTDSIGVIAMGHPNFGTWAILEGMTAATKAAGFSLVIGQLDIVMDPDSPAELAVALEQLLRSGVDGIITSSPFAGSETMFREALGDLPYIVISEHPDANDNSARGNSYSGGLLAMEHLITLGHTQIVHVGGDPATIEAVHREAAYVDALETHGLTPRPVQSKNWTAEWGYEVGLSLDVNEFTAIFAGNDLIAAGIMSALRERELHAPFDYSIVGVDNMVESNFAAPPLTSVDLHFPQLGRRSVEMLIQKIRAAKNAPQQTIAPELIVRRSTAPAA